MYCNLQSWATKWGMEFNNLKCHIMGFNAKKMIPKYTLGHQTLDHVEETKYLRVTLQSNLRFDTHINTKIGKARQRLDRIKRALHWAHKPVKLLAYKTLCSPHLEYAAA